MALRATDEDETGSEWQNGGVIGKEAEAAIGDTNPFVSRARNPREHRMNVAKGEATLPQSTHYRLRTP